MKKFTSILLMLFFALSGLFAANMKGGEVFYLTPHTTWNSDNARYAIYFFNNSTSKNTWVSMTKVEGESNLWTGTVPAGDWANLIFCRMNPSASSNGWGEGVFWGGQTQDLTWDGTNNWFTVDSSKDAWNKPAGTWSTYTPPTPDPEPDQPVDPEDPDTPVDPEDPDQPVDPEDPDTPVVPDPEEPEEPAGITFTVQVPEGTIECYVAGSPSWSFVQMEKVEGEENLFTVTTTELDGTAWKYSSGASWSYVEKDAQGNEITDRKTAGNPDVVAKWALLYEPDAEPIEPYYAIRGLVSWDMADDIKLTANAEGTEYAITGLDIEADKEFKVIYVDENVNITWYGVSALEANPEITQTGTDNIILAAGKYDIYFKVDSKTIWIDLTSVDDPDQPVDPEDPDQPVDPEDPDQPVDPEDPDTPVEPATTITISFASDWETANFYAWNDAATLTATWPGDAMTAADGKFTYEFTLPEGAYYFIINNGNGTQTVNNEGVAESTCFVLDESQAGKWTLAVSAECEATDPKPIETSYVLMGVGGDWATGIAMTPNPDNADEYVVKGQAIAATDAVKVVVFSAEGTNYCGNVKDGSAAVTYDDMGNIMLAEGTYDFYYSISENAIYIGESLTPDPDQPVDPEDPDTPVDPEDPDQPVDPEDPDTPVEPKPVLTVSAEEVVFETLYYGIEPVSATKTITYTIENSEEAAVIALESEVFEAVDEDGTITITYTPETMGEYTAELTITLGDIVKTVAISGTARPIIDDIILPEFDDTKVGEYDEIEVLYTLNQGETATATLEGDEAFEITSQEVGRMFIRFTPLEVKEYTTTLILTADNTERRITLVANGLPADQEPELLTLYYVNNQGWEEVAAYAWDATPIAEWPGELATKTDLTAKGYDVYSYTFDSSKAVNIIFNNNNNGSQTTDLTFDPSKPYFYIDQWYASLEEIEELVSVEEVAAFAIYATNGTIYADCEFAIYNLIGIDVTAQNGSLNGKYIVKTEKGSKLISVW